MQFGRPHHTGEHAVAIADGILRYFPAPDAVERILDLQVARQLDDVGEHDVSDRALRPGKNQIAHHAKANEAALGIDHHRIGEGQLVGYRSDFFDDLGDRVVRLDNKRRRLRQFG